MIKLNWTAWQWYDDSAKPIETKISAVIERYNAKFGVLPNICYVSPEQPIIAGLMVGPVRVKSSRYINAHTFCLGVLPPDNEEH